MMNKYLIYQNQDENAVDAYGKPKYGGFYSNPTIATSSALEALTSTYRISLLQNKSAEYEFALRIGLEFILQLQVRRDTCEKFKIVFPRRAFGGFKYRIEGDENTNMRNDYTQHTLSAMINSLKSFSMNFIDSFIFSVKEGSVDISAALL